jgi:Asp-tRNA(Asn)/Glu-tRNA(Gln) amidotransferase A subunit family amidase
MMTSTPIEESHVEAASVLAGVAMDPAQRALMLARLADQRRLANQLRAQAADADLMPACRFDPRPPGFRPPAAGAFAPPPLPPVPLPEAAADIAFASAGQQGDWIARGLLTSERLTQLYLDRIARLDGTLLAFAHVATATALGQARRADAWLARGDRRGPLHGVPYGCKDILDAAGLPTEWGAEPYRGRLPATDATVVRRLAEAGAVLLGKTSVGALASGDVWDRGQTRTPWNVERGSSGSSAGSAAAVAAGLCGFALGTETLGSIVCPCERCGATGLRPTFGRVARTGAMPLAWSLDKIGPITRTVTDAALVLRAIQGADPGDPSSLDYPLAWEPRAAAGLRVGWFPADFAAAEAHALDTAALQAVRALGCETVALERPERPYSALEHILHAEAAAAFEALTLSGQDALLRRQDAEAWPNIFRAARFLSAVDHVQLDRMRWRVMLDMDAAFAEVDVILGPAQAGPMLTISNFSGHPCMVVPTGMRDATTPHVVCVWGRLFDEGTVLSLALELERAGRFDGRPPLAG